MYKSSSVYIEGWHKYILNVSMPTICHLNSIGKKRAEVTLQKYKMVIGGSFHVN